jgi:hypothetical protein
MGPWRLAQSSMSSTSHTGPMASLATAPAAVAETMRASLRRPGPCELVQTADQALEVSPREAVKCEERVNEPREPFLGLLVDVAPAAWTHGLANAPLCARATKVQSGDAWVFEEL